MLRQVVWADLQMLQLLYIGSDLAASCKEFDSVRVCSHLEPETRSKSLLSGLRRSQVVLPVLLLSASGDFGQLIWRELASILGVALLVVALAFCCCSLRHTCCEGMFNLPEPAPLVPPLCKNSQKTISVQRVLLIYNPNAGKRQAELILNGVVLPGLRKRGLDCDVVATQRVGHAREIGMTSDLRSYQAAVTLGGDGTFHELVNGILARKDGQRVAVSLIPLGTGNGLSATLRQNMQRRGEEVSVWSELDSVLEWSLERIAGGRLASVDLLEVEVMNKRLVAVMQVYVGLLAELDLVAEPLRWMGPARFDLTSVWMILRKQAHPLECKLTFADGTSHACNLSCIGASVGLCQHFDDKLRAVPQASMK
jgi:diacylglycerol kinase family enzyme